MILIYFLFSVIIYRLLIISKIFIFVIIMIAFILLTNYYFDFVDHIQQILLRRGIRFQFGHADIVLLEAYAFCALIGVATIIISIVKGIRTRKKRF